MAANIVAQGLFQSQDNNFALSISVLHKSWVACLLTYDLRHSSLVRKWFCRCKVCKYRSACNCIMLVKATWEQPKVLAIKAKTDLFCTTPMAHSHCSGVTCDITMVIFFTIVGVQHALVVLHWYISTCLIFSEISILQ